MATSDGSLLNHEQALQKYKDILLTDGIEGLRRELNQNAEIWKSTKINIAITGNSGAGKSTFINALLDLDEDNRAEEGLVETTTEIKSFCAPSCSNVLFFDLPGVGTQSFPKNTYAEKVELKKYDFFIIISKSRFTENDIWLVRTIKQLGKRFYFVRTHLQEEIENDELSHPTTHRPDKVIEEIKNDCTTNLQNFEKDVFYIDSYELDKFDFPKLLNTILQESGTLKAGLLAASLAPITQEVLDMKLSFLILRLVQEVVPRIGKDVITDEDGTKLMLSEIAYYRKVFDIDEEKLKTESLFSLSEEESKGLVFGVQIESFMLIARKSVANNLCSAMLNDAKRIGVVGGRFENMIKLTLTAKTTIEPLLAVMHAFHELASDLFKKVPGKFAEMHLFNDI